jgi:hypothetical protein
MTDETKNPSNRVDPSTGGKFHAFWRGRVVFENGRVKRFETKTRRGNFSPAAMRRAKSYIEPKQSQLAASFFMMLAFLVQFSVLAGFEPQWLIPIRVARDPCAALPRVCHAHPST